MKVYHRTTEDAARLIREQRRFLSREQGEVCVSNRARGMAEGYGPGVVALDVPAGFLRLDDEFPGGERHYRLDSRDIRPEWIR